MASWGKLQHAEPELAEFAAGRLHGKIAYLATLRPDNGPRVHPVTPIVGEGHLFLFMKPTSPKGHDLRRDPRYGLHCEVEDQRGGQGELYLHGCATPVDDISLRRVAVGAAPYAPADDYLLFELFLKELQSLRYEGGALVKRRWKDASR